ncbi:aspartate racemase [Reticulomyxa filosa]|uniref:Aspartate racemase n=1 Tax=Reticulomyxa filosa TaxID=46433 RepID=X6LU27_RETFI|nr:aspartate racemase [Reticulomyxa filosa]|eukprot:ETO04235.1 aspartate racemase [Reticulomyxa filosa]
MSNKLIKIVDMSTVKHDMKIIGILGGIPHHSGLEYFRQINDKVQKSLPWKYAGNTSKILMCCVNFEEQLSYLVANRMDMACNLLCEAACRLHRGGADFLVIASNTGHIAIPRIEQVLPHFPYLHIADCCAVKCLERNVKNVALMGTRYTMQQNFIKDRLKLHGLNIFTPPESFFDEMERIIEREVASGKFIASSKKWMIEEIIRKELIKKQGAEACIFGCTDIGLLVKASDVPEVFIVDSLQVHIDAIVDVQLGKKSILEFLPGIKVGPIKQKPKL